MECTSLTVKSNQLKSSKPIPIKSSKPIPIKSSNSSNSYSKNSNHNKDKELLFQTEYGLKQNFFDPTKSSPPDNFMEKLSIHMKYYYASPLKHDNSLSIAYFTK